MSSQYSESEKSRVVITLESIAEAIVQLIDWNISVESADSFYSSQDGMKLLAADCMLITAIGEGINRVNHIMPGYLTFHFPDIPWHSIIGMRNHLAHGYFELDADIVFEAVKKDIPPLLQTIKDATNLLRRG